MTTTPHFLAAELLDAPVHSAGVPSTLPLDEWLERAMPTALGASRAATLAEAWAEAVPVGKAPRDHDVANDVVSRALASVAPVGQAATTELEAGLWAAMIWADGVYDPDLGTQLAFRDAIARRVLARFHKAHSRASLDAELTDERRRASAATTPTALTNYLQHWYERVERWQATWPRWAVPGMENEDVRGHLQLVLLKAIREGGVAFEHVARAGQEASFRVLDAERLRLRRRRRIHVVPEDHERLLLRRASEYPSAEDLLVRSDEQRLATKLDVIVDKGSRRITRTQHRWLMEMRRDLQAHERESLNLARVARSLGRDRAQASRALAALRDALGTPEVIDTEEQ
jgi:hypothetical protein